VLAEDGSIGFCFSYRLRLFEHDGESLASSLPVIQEDTVDHDLDMLMTKTWSPEAYLTMINARRINIDELSMHYSFDPGQESGIARIYTYGLDLSFYYSSIRADGHRAWRFEGTGLRIQLRSDTTLAVQFSEGTGSMRTLLFVSLPIAVDDLIIQENARRDRMFETIFIQGPVFTSNNFGTITFQEDKTFTWRGFDLLVPRYIPRSIEGFGEVSMDLFLAAVLQDRYNGAFSFRFTNLDSNIRSILHCMYSLDNEGFRIEIIPESSIVNTTVTQRGNSPMVMYFYRDTNIW
jgi:hypothetical protein